MEKPKRPEPTYIKEYSGEGLLTAIIVTIVIVVIISITKNIFICF